MKRTDIYIVELIRWIDSGERIGNDKVYYFHETAPIKAFKNYWDARYFIYNEYISKYNLKVNMSQVMMCDILSSSISEEFMVVLDKYFDYIHLNEDKFGFFIHNILFEDGEVEKDYTSTDYDDLLMWN